MNPPKLCICARECNCHPGDDDALRLTRLHRIAEVYSEKTEPWIATALRRAVELSVNPSQMKILGENEVPDIEEVIAEYEPYLPDGTDIAVFEKRSRAYADKSVLMTTVVPGRDGSAMVFVAHLLCEAVDQWMRVVNKKNPSKAVKWITARALVAMFVPR